MRRLVELMAEPLSPEQRLERVVRLIASDMVAEVCSVYVQRAGDFFELFATEGLAPEAVHQTRMRAGEGLVGSIASSGELINTDSASQHPSFVFHPETGEQIYNAFLGVPIVHGGQVVGVLTVQNRASRVYAEEEVEALRVCATVLAEMIALGSLIDRARYSDVTGRLNAPARVEGTPLVEGFALAPALLHRPRVEVQRFLGESPAVERGRLDAAVSGLHASVDAMLELPELATGEQRAVIEAYRMIARDTGWLKRIYAAIDTGLSAEAAVRRVQEHTRMRMSHINEPYLRERLLDLDDLADRLLLHLTGEATSTSARALPEKFILVARNLGPAELLEYDRHKLAGVLLEEGSAYAHVTILARALAVPVLARVRDALDWIESGDLIALDAENGQAFLRPSEDVEQAFRDSIALREEQLRALVRMRDVPTVTADGVHIELNLNAAFDMDLAHLDSTGTAGVGLFRTELNFMVRDRFPDVDTQVEFYRRVISAARGRPVRFRTIDVGSDKLLPYWRLGVEENPAMGWRAVRLTLDRPMILRWQLRALIRAAQGKRLDVMFPMIAQVAELDAVKRLLALELERARVHGEPLPSPLRIGAMIEVPALFWQMPALLTRVDFLSIGSNDLLQFFFACDRGNPELTHRYDVLSPPVLSFLRDLAERSRDAGVELSICGEMAGRPLEAMALMGLGIRSLSMMPGDVPAVKAMLRSLPCHKVGSYMHHLYDLPDRSVRGRLEAYALDHGVVLQPQNTLPA